MKNGTITYLDVVLILTVFLLLWNLLSGVWQMIKFTAPQVRLLFRRPLPSKRILTKEQTNA